MAEQRDSALIFINWNTAEMTLRAVRSARAAAGPEKGTRVILVDNGSSDGSVELFGRELPDAELIRMGTNQGFARAANAGLRTVREPYAFLLNTDLEFRDGVFDALCSALAEDESAALACPKLLRPDGSPQPAAVPEPRIFWELVNRSLPRHLMGIRRDETQAVPGIVGPCMAVDMETIRRVGLLDERFFFFMEETDWCKRINAAGLRILYVPRAEVVHHQGESANRRPTRARIQFYSSRYRFFRKHSGSAATLFLALGLFLRLSLNVIVYSFMAAVTLGGRRFRDRVAVSARLWWWHLHLCPPTWGFEPPGFGVPAGPDGGGE